jgi:hypothetical protein
MSKKQQKEITWDEIRFAFFIEVVPKLLKFATFLSKYFPFSILIPESRVFHYKNKKAKDIWDLIKDKQHYVSPISVCKDDRFYYLFYSNKEISKAEIDKKLKKEDVFVSENEGIIKVLIPRI